MSSLMHHGVKGQRWGVRRFQNKDGTRTAAGKKQLTAQRLSKNEKGIRDVYRSLSDEDFRTLGYSKEEADQERKDDFLEVGRRHTDYDQYNRVRYKDGKAVGYIAATGYQTTVGRGKKIVNILAVDLAVHSEYRGNGYSVALGKDLVRWFDTYGSKEYDRIEWYAMSENIGSQKAAERSGFTRRSSKEAAKGWVKYRYDKKQKLKHTSIGGTMYIEGNALILGDSSYLEHHGIRGQRWGVRRFQNRDGSLTNAGRKRLGYATKGAAQTVGKAFKAGVKAGGNAVKAVKAHHEKKEAEKLQKKKEKASKTRLGVMANKDLFTNEEIRKLNERFKLEDEMKMATLQKGVEIAKAVGVIAQNVGTVAKTYEDVTGQSLSPIKRKAAEEKARQDKEDRERKIAREDAEEARKAAKEERDIAIHEQTLRKAIAAADTQEFTAQKTKAEADSSVLDAIKKGQDFYGGTDATGQSWVEKAKSGGKNPFDDMIADRDPEYAQIRKEHEEKVARKERLAELDRREKERQAEKEAASRQSAPQQKQGGGDDDALFSQKGSLPIDKDRYRNNRAMEKAKQVKEDAAEERAKKQDEKAAKATIDDMMEARRQFTDIARANSNGAFDRETAANYIKGKAKELPSKLNPVNAIARKITNKALKEEEDNARKALENEYKKASRSQGRDEANYTMYYNRVNALQSQGYSERQAKKVADTENPFSSKRNRRFEYNEKVGEIETTHRKNAKDINKANKELTDYYYKLINGPGYDPGTPKREALDRKYAQKRGELERLEKDNNDMLDRETKKAKKILEHSFTIQNGVLFVDSSDGFAHHGVKGQRWGVRRFQNPDGTRTALGKKREMYGATVSVRGQKSSESVGVTKKQAKGKAAAEILKSRNDLSEKERKSLQKHVDRAEKETAKLEKYKEKKKRSQEENTEEAKVEQWNMMTTGMISPDRYKQNIDTINKNHKREIDYLNKMDERDMANERAFTRKTVAKGMGFALAATAGLAGITAATTGWMVISGYAAIGGGMVGVISGEMKRGQYRDQRRKEMGIDDPGRGKVKGSVYAKHDAFTIQNGTLLINTGEPYLEHHGVKGMKWGKHLMAGKNVEAGAGGGGGEDDEKLKEMAKKAGMSVAEYKQKFASKIGGASSKVGEKIYDAAGGKYKNAAEIYRKDAREESNEARRAEKTAHEQSAAAQSYKRKYGDGAGYHAVKGSADSYKDSAELHKSNAKFNSDRANSMQSKYEKSLAGRYDKMKADRARKKSAKEKRRLLTSGSAEAKRISVKDKHLVINRSGSNGNARNRGAARPKAEKKKITRKAVGEALYNAVGGNAKKAAQEHHRNMVNYKNEADKYSRYANVQGSAAKAHKRAGNVSAYIGAKTGARVDEENAKNYRLAQYSEAKEANSAQWKYDHSLAGLYDKATGKYKQTHKKTATPSLAKQYQYYMKETNGKLFDHGKGKGSAKDQAKQAVWNAADNRILADDARAKKNDFYEDDGYGTAYRKAQDKLTERYARASEASYRRAAALGKQAANEGSTSSRPRSRKKKHTSGGSGVTVRRPGRKPVSRTKRVTQSSTGVKRRGSTGSGRSVRRGA